MNKVREALKHLNEELKGLGDTLHLDPVTMRVLTSVTPLGNLELALDVIEGVAKKVEGDK